MYLFLDPRSEDNTITVGIWSGKGKPRFFLYDRNKDRSLLAFIIKKLQAISPKKLRSYKLQAIQGIVIIPGPGGFSTVRAAAVLANTLAFAQGVPIAIITPPTPSYLKRGISSEAIFKQGITAIKSGKIRTSVMPVYYKAPNITKPKNL